MKNIGKAWLRGCVVFGRYFVFSLIFAAAYLPLDLAWEIVPTDGIGWWLLLVVPTWLTLPFLFYLVSRITGEFSGPWPTFGWRNNETTNKAGDSTP